jgi:hypothetical protein
MFGFGVTWCDEVGVKDTIGYPITGAFGEPGGDQAFENGVIFWNPASDSFVVLRSDNHRWQYHRAHRRYSTERAAPNVVGKVVLQGRAAGAGAVLSIANGPYLASDLSGYFSLLAYEQVTMRISYPGYLDRVAVVKVDADCAGCAGTQIDMREVVLTAGDVNGDNRIDILDLSYVGYRFSGSDARADLNGDGVVDILDLSMLGSNFGRLGPEPWQR